MCLIVTYRHLVVVHLPFRTSRSSRPHHPVTPKRSFSAPPTPDARQGRLLAELRPRSLPPGRASSVPAPCGRYAQHTCLSVPATGQLGPTHQRHSHHEMRRRKAVAGIASIRPVQVRNARCSATQRDLLRRSPPKATNAIQAKPEPRQPSQPSEIGHARSPVGEVANQVITPSQTAAIAAASPRRPLITRAPAIPANSVRAENANQVNMWIPQADLVAGLKLAGERRS